MITFVSYLVLTFPVKQVQEEEQKQQQPKPSLDLLALVPHLWVVVPHLLVLQLLGPQVWVPQLAVLQLLAPQL